MAVRLTVAALAAVAFVLWASPVQHDLFQLPQGRTPSAQRPLAQRGVFMAAEVPRKPEAQTWQQGLPSDVPSTWRSDEISRRGVFTAAAAALGAWPTAALAGDDRPLEYKLVKDYPKDAAAMLDNMKTATALTRGTPNFEQTVLNTRKQMNDFVAFYRRQPQITGKPSFSTLYTATNTLAGHYASYGNKYPVPEKRRTRLEQQFKEIERALARGK